MTLLCNQRQNRVKNRGGLATWGHITMKPNVSYQGYRNAQTWCVCVAFKNDQTLNHAALTTVKRESKNHVVCETLLKSIAVRSFDMIRGLAPWAWRDGQSLSDVDWRQIRTELDVRF